MISISNIIFGPDRFIVLLGKHFMYESGVWHQFRGNLIQSLTWVQQWIKKSCYLRWLNFNFSTTTTPSWRWCRPSFSLRPFHTQLFTSGGIQRRTRWPLPRDGDGHRKRGKFWFPSVTPLFASFPTLYAEKFKKEITQISVDLKINQVQVHDFYRKNSF